MSNPVAATPATSFAAPSTDQLVRGRFLWTDLMVPDVEAATRFYPAVTGWTLTSWVMGEGVPPYTMWTAGAAPVGGVMGMSAAEAAGGVPGRWLPYIGTPDVDATYRDALALGAQDVVPPRDIPTVGRFAVLADPQGAGFAIYQPSNAPERGGAPADGEFSWFELGTTDAEAAVAFYTRLFGWARTESMSMGPGKVYQMFGHGSTSVGAIYPVDPGAGRPYWLLYVHVADLAHALDAVRRGGGRVLAEPHEIPGGDYIARCADPQGAEFALHAPAPRAAG
jgi:predicted enzyme related to lactoylglutathione lyase